MATQALSIGKLFDVSGWKAVVSGGGTGIGLMATQALVANGATVFIVGRREDVLKKTAEAHSTGPGKIIPIPGDTTDKDSVIKIVDEVRKHTDKLHLLINNAGIAGPTRNVESGDKSADALQQELWKDSVDDWLSVYKINVVGHYMMAVGFLPLLNAATEATHGFSSSVINISSISGMTRTSQHHMPYNVSKAADIQLTNMLAQEFSRPGVRVRVNSIAPGIFPSEMTTDGSDDQNKSSIDAKGYREEKGIPAGRPGNERDMGQAILMAASNMYLNGETIKVDGGYLIKSP